MHGLQLTWSDDTPNATFNIYRGTTPGGENLGSPLATGIATLGYLDSNGSAGTTYYYVVTAVVAGIEGAPGPEKSGVFPVVPAAPYNFNIAAV